MPAWLAGWRWCCSPSPSPSIRPPPRARRAAQGQPIVLVLLLAAAWTSQWLRADVHGLRWNPSESSSSDRGGLARGLDRHLRVSASPSSRAEASFWRRRTCERGGALPGLGIALIAARPGLCNPGTLNPSRSAPPHRQANIGQQTRNPITGARIPAPCGAVGPTVVHAPAGALARGLDPICSRSARCAAALCRIERAARPASLAKRECSGPRGARAAYNRLRAHTGRPHRGVRSDKAHSSLWRIYADAPILSRRGIRLAPGTLFVSGPGPRTLSCPVGRAGCKSARVIFSGEWSTGEPPTSSSIPPTTPG